MPSSRRRSAARSAAGFACNRGDGGAVSIGGDVVRNQVCASTYINSTMPARLPARIAATQCNRRAATA